MKPASTGIALLCLLLGLTAGAPVQADDDDSPPAAGQLRVEGRIRSLAADRRSMEVEVVYRTTPAGKRKRLSPPLLWTVRLAQGAFLLDRKDPELFLTPSALKPGSVVLLDGAEERTSGALVTTEVHVGGRLPDSLFTTPAAPAPRDAGAAGTEAPAGPPRPAKWEPKNGCYIGAFVMRDENVNTSMLRWEQAIGKGHASYLRYVGYGQPFPQAWVAQVRSLGAAPNIAFEPNNGLAEVQDSTYLREWARAAGLSGGPMFLRFASEMNGTWTAYHGDPQLYREKFRLVARVMREEAPNVALVWTPYCMPNDNIPDYYPGDDAVDWVGVNIYSVHHHDGRVDRPAANEDPTDLLQPIYRRYAARKPIQISEYAATHFCQACNSAMPQWAIRKMTAMYRSLPTRFPRVKMIYWFNWDTIGGGAAKNNYAVTDDAEVLRTYQELIRSDYFLPRIPPPAAAERGVSATEPRTRAAE